MIYTSHRDMDTTWVSKVIAEHHLDPSPSLGFANSPLYWQESPQFRRCVEHYPWGAVIYLLDHRSPRGETMVCVGKLDIETGRVVEGGNTSTIGCAWYQEVVSAFKAAARPATLTIPPCLGYHEACITCDGGLNRTERKMEPECAWKDRCTALQTYCANSNRLPENVLAHQSPSAIVQITTRLVERSGSTPRAQPAVTRPSAPSKPSVPRVLSKPADGVRSALVDKLRETVKAVAEATGVGVSQDWTAATALDGDLYLVDRLVASGYISVYQHGPERKAVASFRVRPRQGGFNVQLPLDKESPHLKGITPDEVKAHPDGKFRCMVKNVEPASRRMEWVRHAMSMIVAGE